MAASDHEHRADTPDDAPAARAGADTDPGPDAGAALPAGPLRSPRAWTIFLVTVLLGLATDLVSKDLAFRHVGSQPVVVHRSDVLDALAIEGPDGLRSLIVVDEIPRRTVIPHVLDLTLVLNPGAVFGLGAGRRWFFIAFTCAAVGFAVCMFAAWTARRDHLAHAGIGLLIAGGLGNLYDRVAFACVRDFIHPLPGVRLPFGRWPNGSEEIWPYVSNLADLYLIIGIAILLIHAWRKPTPPGPEEEAQTADQA